MVNGVSEFVWVVLINVYMWGRFLGCGCVDVGYISVYFELVIRILLSRFVINMWVVSLVSKNRLVVVVCMVVIGWFRKML